ncbi:MAG: hypothetical protein KIS72_08685 [Luteimonas sp.]|nr:hypothetical protein [Luteimonas sp.]
MSWDPLQRGVLEVLGHVLYVVHADGGPAPEAVPGAASIHAAQPPGEAQLRALLRAAGRRADDHAARELCQGWLQEIGLRDAAARRALWPRLRALRRTADA